VCVRERARERERERERDEKRRLNIKRSTGRYNEICCKVAYL